MGARHINNAIGPLLDVKEKVPASHSRRRSFLGQAASEPVTVSWPRVHGRNLEHIKVGIEGTRPRKCTLLRSICVSTSFRNIDFRIVPGGALIAN
jgi:hypothetical protein